METTKLLLVDTERHPHHTLDEIVRSVLTVKDPDGKYKSCDDCGAHIRDEHPEVGLRKAVRYCHSPLSGRCCC